MPETRTCKYEPCSKEFEPTHPRHEFCEPTCRANQHYLEHPEKGREIQGGALRSVATHPLTEARIKQEASKSKVKTRNFAKSGVYIFTAKGRAKLVGLRTGAVENACSESGENCRVSGRVEPSPRSHDTGNADPAASESLTLFEAA
jgi:hypothetical protein